MIKRYGTLQEYHDTDSAIHFKKLEGQHCRIGLLSETSSDVTFTSTDRNGLVLDLSGTKRHLTQMDGILDETPTRPGDVCLVPPGMEARFAWDVKSVRQKSITVEFDVALLATFLPDFEKDRIATGHLVPRGYADRPTLANFARLLGREVGPARARGRLFADSVLRLLAVDVAASHWSVPAHLPGADSRPDARVKRAIEFIENNYASDISLSDIGRASCLSQTQLTAHFQKATGATPYSYVIDRRLRQAVHLLRMTDLTIVAVAIETGFSDQQHLTRAFRARLGKTPAKVRKS